MNKYNNKYRIPSARLKNWNYSNNGAYFITICTKNRDHFFGKITNLESELSEIGKLSEQFWAEIPIHFPFVELGNFVIMPNHMHGILIINNPPPVETLHCNVSNTEMLQCNVSNTEMLHCNVSNTETLQCNTSDKETLQCNTSDKETLQCNPSNTETLHCNVSTINKKMSDISPKSGSISTIIRSYKSIVTKNARLINPNFNWQTRFYDHIIRNEKSFEMIQNYIENNPMNWKEDKFFPR